MGGAAQQGGPGVVAGQSYTQDQLYKAYPSPAASGMSPGLGAALGLQIGGGLFSAFAQGQAAGSQAAYYSYLASTAASNKRLAEAAGKANLEQLGDETADTQRRLGESRRAVAGAQRAALVGGAGVGSKTGEQIAADSMRKADMDEMALRYNAASKAKAIRMGVDAAKMGYDTEAAGYDIAGRNARQAGRYGQISTILGTGGSVASTWYAARDKSRGRGGYG